MKRFTALLLALMLVFALCACGALEPQEITYENMTTKISPAFQYDEEIDGYACGDATVYFTLDTAGEIKSNEVYFTAKEYCDAILEELGMDCATQVDHDTGIVYCQYVDEAEGVDGEMHKYDCITFFFSKVKDDCCEYYIVDCSTLEGQFAKYEADFWTVAKNAVID